jgi:hypothetical protein
MPEPTDGFFPHSYFHVGLVVPDFEAATRELPLALGLTFNESHESTYGPDTIRVAYARPGPPFLEVVQGTPGGQWNTEGGPRMDHVGYFSHDLEADIAQLEAAGLPLDIDGRVYGNPFVYHRGTHTGMRIELIDGARRESLLNRILG